MRKCESKKPCKLKHKGKCLSGDAHLNCVEGGIKPFTHTLTFHFNQDKDMELKKL